MTVWGMSFGVLTPSQGRLDSPYAFPTEHVRRLGASIEETLSTTEDLRASIEAIAEAARAASFELATASGAQRDQALRAMASALRSDVDAILRANHQDVEAAGAASLSSHMIDRLRLTPARVESMASALEEVAALADPLGRVDGMWTRPNGLRVGKMRIPLGVIGFIYEARPNVTSDAAGLCLKSGNAIVLKGGRHALRSNVAVVASLRRGLAEAGLPEGAVGFIDTVEREAVTAMLSLDAHIDLVIPRGGEGLIRFVDEHARMPVIKHYKGVCHIVLDASVDVAMATDIVLNAKCQRPSVCNAAETLLVHTDAAERALPVVAEALLAAGVTLHGCPRTLEILGASEGVVSATDEDWPAEYLSLDLAVKVVADLDEAVAHIRRYGSLHTEAILTQDYAAADRFLRSVDSSTVLVNASTRFADGGQLGLGAEIGISTTKLHAFGPMGLGELTTTKFIVYGHGQTRS